MKLALRLKAARCLLRIVKLQAEEKGDKALAKNMKSAIELLKEDEPETPSPSGA